MDIEWTKTVRSKIQWVLNKEDLLLFTHEVEQEPLIALDVETKMYSPTLCLIQVATPSRIYLIDPLSIGTEKIQEYLDPVFNNPKQRIVIHNASFERRILGLLDITLSNVVDTLKLSRNSRGRRHTGGHSLKVVCERELGLTLDKECQTSDWSLRPLRQAQIDYAALDVEVLLALYKCFEGDLSD